MKNLLGVCSRFFHQPSADKWRSAVAAGITETELGLTGGLPEDKILERADSDCALLEAGGVHVTSVHLPFGGEWDISAPDESRRGSAVDRVQELLGWVGERRIGIAVLHGSGEPIPDSTRAARLAKATAAIRELGMYARAKNVTLAVENLPRTCLGNCADEMLILTDHGRSASICFDVNHLLMETHRDFYLRVAPYVVTTHLSDYDRVDERHWLPGDGCIDWAELIGLFDQQGYQGRFIFEINELASPILGRAFTPEELARRFRRVSGQA